MAARIERLESILGGVLASAAEAEAWMEFVPRHDFQVSTHFHGGAVVCNTAYDNCCER